MTCLCAICRKYQKRSELQLSARACKLLFIVVDLSPVTDIDASAVHFLMVSLEPSSAAHVHVHACMHCMAAFGLAPTFTTIFCCVCMPLKLSFTPCDYLLYTT